MILREMIHFRIASILGLMVLYIFPEDAVYAGLIAFTLRMMFLKPVYEVSIKP